MLGKKILYVFVALFIGIMAVMNSKMSDSVVEGFWGDVGFSTTARPGVVINDEAYAYGGNYAPASMMGSDKFVSVPNYQAMISPRFSNAQYGAFIKYNQPDRKNQAVPCDPLTFGDMATEKYTPNTKEGYCGSSGVPSCGKGGLSSGYQLTDKYELPAGYANGNFNDVYNSLPGKVTSTACQSEPGRGAGDLPVGTMSSVDAAGNAQQFVAFDRIMVVNKKGASRLRSMGDPIRGDLAITPCQSGWFSVYPTLSRDLQEGAMNILSGVGHGGDNYQNLMKMIVESSGGAQTALGGADISEWLRTTNMAGSTNAALQAGAGDIVFSSFP